jgi:hypothetical protein
MALSAIAGAIGKGITGLVGGMGKKGAKKKGADVASKMFDKKEEKGESSSPVSKENVTIIKRPKVNIEKVVDNKKIEEVQVEVEDPKLNPLKSAMDGLTAIAYSMKETVDSKVEIENKNQSYSQKRLTIMQRAGKAGRGIMSGIIGAANKLSKQFDFFDSIKNFLLNVLIGGIIAGIIKNWESIMETWEEWKEGFMEWKERFDEFLDIFNTFFWEPLKGIFAFLFGPIIEQLAKFMGVPDNEAESNTIDKNLLEILKEIPLIGDAVKALSDDINGKLGEMNVDGNVSGGSSGTTSGYVAGSAPKPVANDKEFQSGVTDMAKRMGVSEDYLYAVMSFETGGSFDPAQKNMAGSGATGLIQFMPETAQGLGTSTSELAGMNRTEQLKYVEKYLKNAGVKKGASLSDMYMAVLLPAAVGKSDDFVLFGEGGAYGGSRAYSQNKGLDANRDGRITKGEATAKVRGHLSAGSSARTSDASTPPSERSSSSTDTSTSSVADVEPPSERSSGGGSGNIVEYITGDRSSSGYRADHGGNNYHEHLAFSSKSERDKAIAFLRGKGVHIGSMNDGRHAPGSYHYSDQAFDIPLYPNIQNFGIPDNRSGEEKFSGMIRDMLSEAGFTGSGIGGSSSGTPSARVTPPAQRQTSAQAKAVSNKAFYEELDQYIVKAKIPVPSSGVSGGGGGGPTVITSGSESGSLNRKQQYDYKKFLYKG